LDIPEIGGEDTKSYDFGLAPVPRRDSLGIENTVNLLYSEQHLNGILKNEKLRNIFATFLAQLMPGQLVHMDTLSDNEKAIAAIAYANALARARWPTTGSERPVFAAHIDAEFHRRGQEAFDMLLAEALPAYITHVLTNEVTRYMEGQIPRMRSSHEDRQPLEGIFEAFCLTDPKMEGHPIIYASEEFFRLTQCDPDNAIGRNCKFLQGRETSSGSVTRLSRAIDDGRAVCETILNYRPKASPFLNLLLVAPLHDDQGNVKASFWLAYHSRGAERRLTC
jgi:PAS domain-containing protein